MVQCIHLNAELVVASITPCGCLDFFLNVSLAEMRTLGEHSAYYFACIIFDWTLNKNNQCIGANSTEMVGFHSRGTCGVYHIDTTALEPYCPVSGSTQ